MSDTNPMRLRVADSFIKFYIPNSPYVFTISSPVNQALMSDFSPS